MHLRIEPRPALRWTEDRVGALGVAAAHRVAGRNQRVPQRDRPDVEQGIVLAARRSMCRGMYRPASNAELHAALRARLYGVRRRRVSHYLKSAYVRHAVLPPSPFGMLRARVGSILEAQVAAHEVLEAMADLPTW
ncbi:hypothetical protein WMF31_07160 [Sorangium sp. So ce1036]|uniref:hypothetical protein n=1 Tax=Sorangium sp. So ce1036 TaxID=3133328 RepID=UPI003EFE6EF8